MRMFQYKNKMNAGIKAVRPFFLYLIRISSECWWVVHSDTRNDLTLLDWTVEEICHLQDKLAQAPLVKHTQSVSRTMNINTPALTKGNCVCTAPAVDCATAICVFSLKIDIFFFKRQSHHPLNRMSRGYLRFKRRVERLTHPLLTCKYKGNGPRALRGWGGGGCRG